MDPIVSGLARARALRAALSHGAAADALLEATVAQGFSREVAARGIAAELESWRDDELAELLGAVVGDVGNWPRAVLILAARTLPASAMRQVFFARALGARAHLKAASGQGALGDAMAMADEGIESVPFTSDDGDALSREVERADTIVVLGSDETVSSVSRHVSADKGFAGHGHKVSAALVMRWPSPDELDGLARDLLAWDQAGCLAPLVVWTTSDRSRLAEALAEAVKRAELELPLAEGKRLAQTVARREMTTLAAMLGEVACTTGTATIATHPEASLRLPAGPRCLWVLPFERAALEAATPVLSSLVVVGEAGPFDGAIRLCGAGELQRPALSWRQDGLHPLRSLLRR